MILKKDLKEHRNKGVDSMFSNKPLIVIVGPTATGKTEISIMLAKRLSGAIISADSMQLYKYLNIGSAKPSKEEMSNIQHYMIDEIDPGEEFSVACYKERVYHYMKDIYINKKNPILVGGTGLYVNAIINNIDFFQSSSDPDYRKQLEKCADENGNQYIYDFLISKDPARASQLHPNDRKRVIRALEILNSTGKPIPSARSVFQEQNGPFKLAIIGLYMDRLDIHKRINQRVDTMVASGLLEEVKSLLAMGYARDIPALQGLGYKEMICYLRGECSFDDAVQFIKRDTRRFAKRQMTWFKRDQRISWYNVLQYKNKESLAQKIELHIREKIL